MNDSEAQLRYQIHFHLSDHTHSLDAGILNQCEYEILCILNEINEIFDTKIIIEAEALTEGGIFKNLALKCKSQHGLTALTTFASIATLLIGVYQTLPKEIDKKREKDIDLSIQERELNIRLMKKQLKDDSVNIDTIKKASEAASKEYKVKLHKSNLYKAAISSSKISAIGIKHANEKSEFIIHRDQFISAILEPSKPSVEKDENAIIDIVSPVLKEGTYKWKGIYKSELISFDMEDPVFRSAVLAKKLSFANGIFINCILEFTNKENDDGKISSINWKVKSVTEIDERASPNPGMIKRNYRAIREKDGIQVDLFKAEV